MDKIIRIFIDDGSVADYAELDSVLTSANFRTKRLTDEIDSNTMGLDLTQLVIILPVVFPYIEQLQKTLSSYFLYKKGTPKKYSITLENDGKKLKMDVENADLPSIEEFLAFFNT